MEETPPPKRRLMLGTVLTAVGAFGAMEWIGRLYSKAGEVFSQVKVPIPAVTALYIWIHPVAWMTAGLILGLLVCLKDFWMPESRARSANVVALALLFLFILGSLQVFLMPQLSLLEGINGRR